MSTDTKTASPAAIPASPAPAPTAAPAPAAPPPAPQFPAAPEGFVNVLINGKHTIVGNKDNLIEAAKRIGVEIPYFCYHPKLSIAGQCRMCLVETSEMPGRLVPGCQVRVKEGLHIKTETPAIIENQRAIMEFHLVNHPVDCPICDQSGECKLQDYHAKYNHRETRLATVKVNKPKRKEFGPMVVYDAERCILCTRCVRFMNEVADDPQIAMVGRGDHSEIDVVPGMVLDSKYSGNTVDICPVGALLNRDFRFQSRTWYLDGQRSVCTGCSNGCNLNAEYRGDKVYRLLPKKNEAVNDVWLCDDGRLTYHRTNDNRLETARFRASDEDGLFPSIEFALDAAHKSLSQMVGKNDVAVIISAMSSTEEAYAAALFAKDILLQKTLYISGNASGVGDDFLIREDKNPNTNGVKLAATQANMKIGTFEECLKLIDSNKIKHVLMIGADVPTDETKTAEILKKTETCIVLSVSNSAIAKVATLALPASSHHEFAGTFVNYYGRLQRFLKVIDAKYESKPSFAWLWLIAKAMGSQSTIGMKSREIFGTFAKTYAPLEGALLETLPEEGVVLPDFKPLFALRAPRPAAPKPTPA